MKVLAVCLALCLVVEAQRRGGVRPQGGSRRPGGRRPAPRRGRQEDLGAGSGYAAPSDAGYSAPGGVPVYAGAASDAVPVYGGAGDDALTALQGSIPGIPGEDYPINAEVPETGFSCEGQVDGGYYADPADPALCQVFHICTADGHGSLAKYSFLCPNGTIFNQNYFICDWWFNFDCSEAEGLYSINEEIAAEREAASAAASDQASYGAPLDSYAPTGPAADPALGGYEDAARAGRRLGNRRNNRRPQGRRFRG